MICAAAQTGCHNARTPGFGAKLFLVCSDVARAFVQGLAAYRMNQPVRSLDNSGRLQYRAHLIPIRTALRILAPVRTTQLRQVSCAARNDTSDVAVIGAGAAGLTAAYFAAQRGAAKVLHMCKPLNKQA